MQAGFAKRILYGTDLMIWPELLETSIGVIENATYLSEEQKRDILFNNAVRFFNLDASKFDWFLNKNNKNHKKTSEKSYSEA